MSHAERRLDDHVVGLGVVRGDGVRQRATGQFHIPGVHAAIDGRALAWSILLLCLVSVRRLNRSLSRSLFSPSLSVDSSAPTIASNSPMVRPDLASSRQLRLDYLHV